MREKKGGGDLSQSVYRLYNGADISVDRNGSFLKKSRDGFYVILFCFMAIIYRAHLHTRALICRFENTKDIWDSRSIKKFCASDADGALVIVAKLAGCYPFLVGANETVAIRILHTRRV